MDVTDRHAGAAGDHDMQLHEGVDILQTNRLDDQQWNAIVDLLPGSLAVRARNNDRLYRNFVEGVLWVVGEDAYWGELPARYGSWRAIYVRFLRWNTIDVWPHVAEVLGRDEALARALLARAGQHAAIVRRRRTRYL